MIHFQVHCVPIDAGVNPITLSFHLWVMQSKKPKHKIPNLGKNKFTNTLSFNELKF
jgi:hypothetical protein